MVVRAVNEVITGSFSFIPTLQASFERCLGDSNSAAVEGIDAHLLELQQELLKLANAKQNYDVIADDIDELRAEKEGLLLHEANKDGIRQRMADMVSFLQSEPEEVTEYSEALVSIRFVDKENGKRPSDWKINDRWAWFIGDGRRALKLTTKPEHTLERTLNWVARQVAPTLKMLEKIDAGNGTDYLEAICKNAKLTEKHEQIIRQQTAPVEEIIQED